MAPIAMDPTVLTESAALYKTARNAANDALGSLAEKLHSNWGSAGTDNAGKTWADSYDAAAFAAVAAGTDIVNALGKLHDLLAATGVNHSNTENANAVPPIPPLAPPAELTTATSPQFNGSYGGDTDAPLGWGLITRWLGGHMWPNGDPEKLHQLGSAWQTASEALIIANESTDAAWVRMEDLASDELPQALAQMDGVYGAINRLADEYRSLGAACDKWAHVIDDAHQQIVEIVGTAIVAGTIAGAIGGFFTLGAGTVAVTGATGGAIAGVVITALTAVEVAAAVGVGVAVAVGTATIGIAGELQPLLDSSPTRFDANAGGRNWNYNPPPKDGLPGFPSARKVKPLNHRKRWEDDKGNTYEWDYQHGAVEKYGKNGNHLGEFDANTGNQTKPPDPTRKPGR